MSKETVKLGKEADENKVEARVKEWVEIIERGKSG